MFEYKNKQFPLQLKLKLVSLALVTENVHFAQSAPDFSDIKEFISDDLIQKVVKELIQLDYAGVIRFSGFVEPLLDKKILIT